MSRTAIPSPRTKAPALQNLLKYSLDLSQSVYDKTNTSVAINTTDVLDPLGTNTATKITATGTGLLNHWVQQSTVISNACPPTGRPLIVSAYVKAGTARYMVVGDDTHTINYIAIFDFNNSVISLQSNCTAAAQAFPNGWWKITCSYTVPSAAANSANAGMSIHPSPITTTTPYNFTAAGETCYVWGLQSVQSNWAGALTPTTTVPINTGNIRNVAPFQQNLLIYSQQIDLWNQTALTVSANSTTAPDGTATADKIQENNGNTYHEAYLSIGLTERGVYTVSCFAKAEERSAFAIVLSGNTYASMIFDLVGVTATVGAQSAGCGAIGSIVPVAGAAGWFKCTVTATIQFVAPCYIFLCPSGSASPTLDGSGRPTYQGVTGYGLDIWQMQLTRGNNPGPLCLTTTTKVDNGNLRNIAPSRQRA